MAFCGQYDKRLAVLVCACMCSMVTCMCSMVTFMCSATIIPLNLDDSRLLPVANISAAFLLFGHHQVMLDAMEQAAAAKGVRWC